MNAKTGAQDGAKTQGRVIVLAGVAGSGKDTVAAMIKDEVGARYTAIRFADPIKNALLAMFDREPYRVYYDQVFGPSGLREKQIGDLTTNSGSPLTIRYALQTMGTELGRDLWNRNIWAKIGSGIARQLADKGRTVVIPDGRFDNEFEIGHEIGAEIWHIDRPGAGLAGNWPRWGWVKHVPPARRVGWMSTQHPSERDLTSRNLEKWRTAYLPNVAGLPELREHVRTLLEA